MSTLYPTPSEIITIFSHLASGNPDAFFAHVSPTVSWTITGTHPLAGTFNSLSNFRQAAFARISAVMKEDEPFRLDVVNVAGGSSDAWAVTELKARGVCKNGLVYGNRYAWVHRWNEERKIVEVRAYLDSALVKQALEENE
ncbi:MAG: hypothetical protein M1822_000705 [Bathelium mastoideum]|nr:MAG: hypothetical protein M1822_000705 [Bathelium mastoideum]